MAYTDKELKDATQVVYLNLLEKTLNNLKADGDIDLHSLRDLIMTNINIESVKKNLKYEDKYTDVSKMSIQELVEYAEISEADKEKIKQMPDEVFNWKIRYLEDKNDINGFYGCVIETSGDSAIVAFRGSEGFKDFSGLVNDWLKADFGSLKNECTDQQKAVEEFLNNLKKEGILDKYKSISSTGHSLGGNLASHFAVAIANDERYKDILDKFEGAVSFDGPGVSKEYLKKYKFAIDTVSDKITHYIWSPIGDALNYLPGENVNYLKIDEKQHKKNIGDQIWYKTFYRHHTDSIMFSKSGKAIRGDHDAFSKVIHGISIGVDGAPVKIIADILIPNYIQTAIGIAGTVFKKGIYQKDDNSIGFKLFGTKEDEKKPEVLIYNAAVNESKKIAEKVRYENGKNGHKDVIEAVKEHHTMRKFDGATTYFRNQYPKIRKTYTQNHGKERD